MKKILFAVLTLSLILVIIGLSRSIYDLWKKQDLVISYQKQLAKQKAENQALKQKLSTTNNPKFLEEQVRDNLFMVKPGEQDVIISKELLIGTSSAKPIEEEIANWKKWWHLFF
ncbi:MAG: septum formation initiator family protein [Candidatus Levybacteria bacterium]|nr:septum formation initiator family protein [Candidatus Levybacteria bacterium]